MRYLEIFVIKNEKIFDKNFSFIDGPDTYNSIEDIKKQAKELNVDYHLHIEHLSEIPRRTDSFLFVILEENSFIPIDYLARIMSVNNLHRDMACVCGPRITRYSRIGLDIAGLQDGKSGLLDYYYKYELDSFSTFISCYLNGQNWLYPPTTSCVYSGRHYNSVGGYTPLESPRGPIQDNPAFMSTIDRAGPIVYNERLRTYKFVTHEETDRKHLSKYCYDRGFLDKSINHESYLYTVLQRPTYEDLLSSYQLGMNEFISGGKIFNF